MIPGIAPAVVVKKPAGGAGIKITLGYGDVNIHGFFETGYIVDPPLGDVDNSYIDDLAEYLDAISVVDYSLFSPGEKVFVIAISNDVSSLDLHFKITTDDGVFEYDSADFTVDFDGEYTLHRGATAFLAGLIGVSVLTVFPWPVDGSMNGKTVYLEITEN